MDGWRRGLLGLMWLVGCVTAAPQGDTGGSEGSSEASTTEGGSQCPPPDDCTVPIPEEWCDADPGSPFDENCCKREYCGSHAECDDGLVCAPVVPPVGCTDQVEDGQTVCTCGGPPNGRLASLCVPPSAVEGEWCNTHWTEAECNAAEPIPLGPNDLQFCRWIEVQNMNIHDPIACGIDEPASRCLTIQMGYDPGCAAPQCTSSDGSITLGGPMARAYNGGTDFEVFGVDDLFCGSGIPVGGWIAASDASLGACAFTCE